MFRIISFLFVLLLSLGQPVSATPRDTLSVMVYNLLFYGHYTSFCTPANNNTDDKDEYLKTIINHTLPDIFAVNEMGPDPALAGRILDNVMNTDGRTAYAHATYTNTANSNLVNMMFYNSEKVRLHNEAVVTSIIRDINLYSLYYNDPGLAQGADTVFMHVMVAHLKAGNSTSDQQFRLNETRAVMNYIQENDLSGNVFFMGDFNMNSSFDQAYQELTYHPNEAIRFYDPIDKPGVWFNNPDMAPYHTQSPRTGQHDCFVTGGLDDRYDQILSTLEVMEGLQGILYLADTYETIGQDGLRFNQSLINPPNHSEPPDVINALYNMSDHLPVKLRLGVTDFISDVNETPVASPQIRTINIPGKRLELAVENYIGSISIEVISVQGTSMMSKTTEVSFLPHTIQIDISALPAGIYFVRAIIEGGVPAEIKKFVVPY